jgi:putative membrane protein
VSEPNPYDKYRAAELIARDHLALDRTRLANERTLLAYLRSGVALVLAGATLMHFAATSWLAWVGLACIPLGIATLLFGSWRFAVTAKRLRHFS